MAGSRLQLLFLGSEESGDSLPLKHNGHLSPCGVIQIQYQLKAIPILPLALLCNTLIVAGLHSKALAQPAADSSRAPAALACASFGRQAGMLGWMLQSGACILGSEWEAAAAARLDRFAARSGYKESQGRPGRGETLETPFPADRQAGNGGGRFVGRRKLGAAPGPPLNSKPLAWGLPGCRYWGQDAGVCVCVAAVCLVGERG